MTNGTRRRWGVSVRPRPLLPPVPIVQEAGWAPGPVWTGAENLPPTGIRSPDRPARSQSLYRLRYKLTNGTRRRLGVSVTPRPLLPTVPVVQEAGWAPGPVWTGAENLPPTGIRPQDRPARSQSLYRLRHPARVIYVVRGNKPEPQVTT
jgi:hypothetical protein